MVHTNATCSWRTSGTVLEPAHRAAVLRVTLAVGSALDQGLLGLLPTFGAGRPAVRFAATAGLARELLRVML
jgi:hypothetical protein